jgi:signal transduction histidine kinase
MSTDIERSWPDGWFTKQQWNLATSCHEAVVPTLAARWSLHDDVVRQGVNGYVRALIDALDLGSSQPVLDYIASLDSMWQAPDFDIEPIVRSMFTISDVFKDSLPPTGADEARRAVDAITRHAVTMVAGRSVSIVTTQLEEQVQRHQSGEARLRSVQRVATAVMSELDLNRTLALIADEALRLIGADAVSIRLPDGDGALSLFASSGTPQHMLPNTRLLVDDSLSGEAFRTGRSTLVNNAGSDPRVNPAYYRATQARSVLIVPLLAWDRSVGVLSASSGNTDAFTRADEDTLTLFAGFAAGAIENAKLYSQARDQIAELAMLHRVTNVVSSSLELDEVFQALFEEVRALMPADAFLIALTRDDERYDLEFIIEDGRRYPPTRGIEMSEVLRSGIAEQQPLIIDDVFQHHLYTKMNHVGNPERRTRSVLAVPLLRGRETIGLISVQSYEPYNYGDRESRMLMTIANQAAVAIEHARLYQDAQSLGIAEERNRLAREIHDTLAQGLIGIILFLERVDESLPAHDTSTRELVQRSLMLARGSLDEARRSVRDLRAAPLEGRSLLQALGNLAAALRDEADFEVDIRLPLDLPPLSARVETALFRVVQEAVMNCQKHSGCRMLEIDLSTAGDLLRLSVVDDGVGFEFVDDGSDTGHYGLKMMRERIIQIGGAFRVESRSGSGTRLHAELPIALVGYSEMGDEGARERRSG